MPLIVSRSVLPTTAVPAIALALGSLAIAPLDIGLAIYFVVAELLAWFGSSCEVILDSFSRPGVLELASARGDRAAVETRLQRVPLYELTARLVRFLGNALLVLGVAYVAFRDQLGAGGSDVSWSNIAWVVLIAFLVVFVVNDILVRIVARRDPDRALLASLPGMEFLTRVTAPIRVPIVWLARFVFRVRLAEAQQTVREEVRESVEEGEREGSFSTEEAEMIGSIIDFGEATVDDILVPRADIMMVRVDTPLEEAVELVVEAGYSRIPVFRRDRDDVIGVLYARDLLKHWRKRGQAATDSDPSIESIMREAFFVPETKPLSALLKEMRTKKIHLAIVLDAFAGTAGLVSIEDVLEEIVGEIQDEYDEEEDEELTREEIHAASMQVDGRTTIEEVNKALDVDLPLEDDFETVGGLVFHRLGKVPAAGDRVELQAVALTVLEADERTVKRLQIDVAS